MSRVLPRRCKTSSGSERRMSIPWSSVWVKNRELKLHGFELLKILNKGTKILYQVIKAITNQKKHLNAKNNPETMTSQFRSLFKLPNLYYCQICCQQTAIFPKPADDYLYTTKFRSLNNVPKHFGIIFKTFFNTCLFFQVTRGVRADTRPTHNALLHLAFERSVRGLECTQHSVHSKSWALKCTQHSVHSKQWALSTQCHSPIRH